MKKKTLVIVLLLTMVAPFVLYTTLDIIRAYIPFTGPDKKSVEHFEKAFNEQMAQYGMSIDIDSARWHENEGTLHKPVPIQCEDGSTIICTYYPIAKSPKSQIRVIEFEQSLNSKEPQTIYIVPLMEFILQEFEGPMLEDKDKAFDASDAVSYNEAIRYCQTFVDGEQKEFEFYVSSVDHDSSPVFLTRETGEKKSIKIRIFIFSGQRSW
jgi:hypothetical protein